MISNRRVFGLIRLDFDCDVPSKIWSAVRSSGEIRLKQIGFFVGDVNDFIFSFSISNRIFSFRRRLSSSFQSRCFRNRVGSVEAKKSFHYNIYDMKRYK